MLRKHLQEAARKRGRIAVPEWIPTPEWNAYLDMRDRIGKGATEYAQELILRHLSGFRQNGQGVASILNQSTRNEWTGLCEVGQTPYRPGC